MPPTVHTAYEVALAAVPNAKKTVLPGPTKTPPAKVARKMVGPAENSRKKMHPARAKDEAVKAVTGKGSTKAKKPAAKSRGAGNDSGPTQRLTMEWLYAKGKDMQVKDQARLPDGIIIEVIGRWTKRKGDQLIPMVTGRIVSDEGKGSRRNAVAAEVTHVAKK